MMRKPFRYPRKNRGSFKQKSQILRIKPEADGKLKKVFSGIGVPVQKPFRPDPFQQQAISFIPKNDCLVTAPTGAGKTWIAEQIFRKFFNNGKKSWYASPLKALSNSKYIEFSDIFTPKNVGILTGDRKENPDAPIIIGTTEILRNQLYDAMCDGKSISADFVVLDEAHFLGDEDRGVVWEEIIIYLPPRIPILMLSATIGNAHEIARWISSIRLRECLVVEERKRPVPLYPLFLHPSGTILPLLTDQTAKGKTRLSKKVKSYVNSKSPPVMALPRKLPPFGDILRVLKKYRLLPAIFFLKSRADCDKAIELCDGNRLEDQNRQLLIKRRIKDFIRQNPHIGEHRQRRRLETLAVGSHHSGQLPAWKLVLENLMTEGLLDAVFATSTVAAGVNFPARSIVFLNSDRFNGVEFKPLTATEFHQMTGRAGRRGKDQIGFAVAIPGKFMDARLVARLMTSPPTAVSSQIKINFSMVLNLLMSHTPDQIEELLEKSFAAFQLTGRKNKKRIFPGISDSKFLWKDFKRHMHFLKTKGFINELGKLTDDGTWTSRLRIDQPLLVAEGLRREIFPESDPALLAAIFAAFVNDRESDDRIEKKHLSKKVETAFLKVRKGLRPFAKDMFQQRFDVRPLFIRPAVAIYAWALGKEWTDVLSLGEMEEGDLAMLILRTADHLRHLKTLGDTFPEISESADIAIDLIMREPVVL